MTDWTDTQSDGDVPRRSSSFAAAHVGLLGRSGDACAGPESRRLVCIAEIDRFAALRQRMGYTTSNVLIGELADRVRNALPGCDLGRVGRTSVEFAFAAGSLDEAGDRLARVVAEVERPFRVDDIDFDLTVTIGAVDAGDREIDDRQIDAAVAALRIAQERHEKVALQQADAAQPGALDDLSLVRDLRRALKRDELALHYQPKLRSRTETIDSAEALLRWDHPELGPVRIDKLIELAEATGAIRELTFWVIDRALADRARLAALGHPLTIFVNISGVLLPDTAFADWALSRLAGAKGTIGFEITETAVIERSRRWRSAICSASPRPASRSPSTITARACRRSPISSSFPRDELKIDRMFVKGLTESQRDPLLVRSSIDLAHALEMEVTAEGVDDADVAVAAADHGLRHGAGLSDLATASLCRAAVFPKREPAPRYASGRRLDAGRLERGCQDGSGKLNASFTGSIASPLNSSSATSPPARVYSGQNRGVGMAFNRGRRVLLLSSALVGGFLATTPATAQEAASAAVNPAEQVPAPASDAAAELPDTRLVALGGTIRPFGGDMLPYAGNIRSFAGPISGSAGNIRSFAGNIRSFEGDATASAGNIRSFAGNIRSFAGNIRSFTATTLPATGPDGKFWGDLYPASGTLSASAGNIRSFSGAFEAYAGNIRSFAGNIRSFAGNIRSFDEGAATYTDLNTQIAALVEGSKATWGAAVTARTGKSFEDAFATPLLTKYGIDLNDPRSLVGLDELGTEVFLLDWYDNLMNYSGVDQIDHWMKAINWTPADHPGPGFGPRQQDRPARLHRHRRGHEQHRQGARRVHRVGRPRHGGAEPDDLGARRPRA